MNESVPQLRCGCGVGCNEGLRQAIEDRGDALKQRGKSAEWGGHTSGSKL